MATQDYVRLVEGERLALTQGLMVVGETGLFWDEVKELTGFYMDADVPERATKPAETEAVQHIGRLVHSERITPTEYRLEAVHLYTRKW